jgi:2-C-methyl-D-erythritol 4-phosphate cytidylyltransferase / 2-C-methyl-D-erythritol 2,4-cyclodiphosphate synthase
VARHELPKQFRVLADLPMWEWSYEVLKKVCDPVVMVAPESQVSELEARGIVAVTGGASRQSSVAAGLARIETEHVVVHDAARPFLTEDILSSAIDALDDADGSFAAIPVRETLAFVRDGAMAGVVPRESILNVQTPQAFSTAALKDAHTRALKDGITEATDDAQIVANYGYQVVPIQGDARNMKITYAEDFVLAEAMLRGTS